MIRPAASVPVERTAAHALIDVLLAWGVEHVFICPGSTEAPFLDAVVDRPELKIWVTTHEVTAVAMADGFARVSRGIPGVAFLHTNVGLANGLGGMYSAQMGRSPVVVLSGLKARAIQSRRGFTAPNHVGNLTREYVKWEWQSLDGASIADDLTRALQIATTSPPGPVWLGLGEDLLGAAVPDIATPDRSKRRVASVQPDGLALAKAATLLATAKNPVVVAGADISRDAAGDLLLQLSEALTLPVMHEDRRSFERSVFPTTHPYYAGLYSVDSDLIRRADVIAFLGGRCFHEFEAARVPLLPEGVQVIHSNADAAEIGKTYGADIGLVGDHRQILTGLLGALAGNAASRSVLRAAPPTHASAAWMASGAANRPLSVFEVVEALSRQMTVETTVVADATTSNAALIRDLPQARPDQLLTTTSGALGWGMGAALGIQVADPGGRVVSVVGDGSFQFGIQAMSVAARYDLPVTFLVINNESYAAVAAGLRRYGRRAVEAGVYPGKDISGTNIAAVGEGFGVPSVRVRERAALDQELARALAAAGPVLVEAMTDPEDFGP